MHLRNRVKAAVEAVKEREDIFVILTGLEDVIKKELNKYQGYPEEEYRSYTPQR